MFKGANIYLDKILMLEGAKEAIKKNVSSSQSYSNKNSINNTLNILAKKKSILIYYLILKQLEVFYLLLIIKIK